MEKHKDFLKRWKDTFIIFLLPIISYCILGPLEIYFGNKKDFSFAYTDFFGYTCVIAAVLLLFGSFVAALLPKKLNHWCNVLVLGFGVASYIQNMFLNRKLSEADGGFMRWETLGNYPIVNFIVWVLMFAGIIALSIFAKKSWRTIAMGTAGFLSAVQLVAVLALVLPAALSDKEPSKLVLDGDTQFHVASERNLLVFILDSYGNEYFERVVQDYPEIAEPVKDFTYYNNADCGYYWTFPSLVHAFTGIEYDFNAETTEAWMKQAWNSERATHYFEAVKKAGYAWNLYSPDINYTYGGCENLLGRADNVKEVEHIVDVKRLLHLLCKMSCYKYVPYVVKPVFEVLTLEFDNVDSWKEGRASFSNSGAFYIYLKEEGLSVEKGMKNAVIIQHLMGMHGPHYLDENANIVDDTKPEQVVRGLSVILEDYFRRLKELDLYDSADIIIMADHGSWDAGAVQPIFMVKRRQETRDKMEVNTAPISLSDFQATTLALMGEDYQEFGTSIFDWKEGESRERTVYNTVDDSTQPNVRSPWNAYYGYTYETDRKELYRKIENDEKVIIPAVPWQVLPW